VRVIDTFRTVLSLAYSPCGRYVYSAGWEHVSRWNVNTGEETPVYHARGTGYHTSLAVSPSGKRLGWVEQAGRQLHLSNANDVNRPRSIKLPFSSHTEPGAWWGFVLDDQLIRHTRPLVTDPTGRGVAFQRDEGLSLAVLDRPPRKPVLATSLGIGDLPLSGVRRLTVYQPRVFGFATAAFCWWHQGDELWLYDAERGTPEQTTRPQKLPVAVTPNGRTGIAFDYRQMLLTDLPSGLIRERFDWEVGMVEAVAVAPDGLTASVAGWAGGIAIFDLGG
jgi:hypothetical protein